MSLRVLVLALPGLAISCTSSSSSPPPEGAREVWSAKLGSETDYDHALLGGVADAARVYVEDFTTTTFALDAATGELVWSVQPGDSTGYGLTAAGERVLVWDTDLGVYALDAATGQLAWHADVWPHGRGGGNAVAGIIAASPRDRANALIGLHVTDGSVAWTTPAELVIDATDAANDDTAFYTIARTSAGSELVALEATTGAPLWRTPVELAGAELYAGGGAVLADQLQSDGSDRVRAFDAATGTLRWDLDLANPLDFVFAADEVVTTDPSGVLGLALADGSRRFEVPIDRFKTPNDVALCGRVVCAVGLDQFALVAADGTLTPLATVDDADTIVPTPVDTAAFLASPSTVHGYAR